MKVNRYIVLVVRLLLAAVFVFSGFVKAVDPWGTAIKIGEYLSAFGMDWLYWARFPGAILLSGFELMLGLMLLSGVRLRLGAFLAMLMMICMTGLTLYIAMTDPVNDCGCFGEAVKLSNWNTFFKNLILLPMSILVWRTSPANVRFSIGEGIGLALMAAVSFGIGVYSYRHLPLIDFLPYKVGTDLRVAEEDAGEHSEPQMVYRDKRTGKEQVFALSDTTWYDSDRWEWVETLDNTPAIGIRASVRDFRIYDGTVDVTDDYILSPGKVLMILASDIDDIKGKCAEKLEYAVAVAQENGVQAICLTASPVAQGGHIEIGGQTVPCYNVDGTTLKTMLRARVGVVVLQDGVITHKANCRDVLRGGSK